MTVHDSHQRDAARPSDSKPPIVEEAARTVVVERLQDVAEPSSSVDHLLAHLAGGRPASTMTFVDWVLPVSRTDGDVVLKIVRPDDDAAYLGFTGGRYVATPWRTRPVSAEGDDLPQKPVAARDWFPEDARVEILPVELSPFDD